MTDRNLASLPFAEATTAWLETRKPYISPRTQIDYANYIQTLTTFFGHKTPVQIDANDVRAYQRIRMERAGASIINHECSVLQQLLKRCDRWHFIVDHYQPLPLPKQSPHRALTEAEEQRLYEIGAANPQWEVAYCAFVISINTTAGPGELRHVRLKDVQMDHPKGPLFSVQPEGAKNDGRIRSLPLNAQAAEAMRHLLARAKRLGASAPDHYLLPFRVKTGFYDPTRPCKHWKYALRELLAAAGIKGSAYMFRHHAIAKLLENPDVSEETAEAIAGHISHAMKKRYSHIRDERKRAALASLSRIHQDDAPPPMSHQASLTNADVIAMLKDLPQEIVIAKIKAGPCRFQTFPDTLKQLKASGVPDKVIVAMLKAS